VTMVAIETDMVVVVVAVITAAEVFAHLNVMNVVNEDILLETVVIDEALDVIELAEIEIVAVVDVTEVVTEDVIQEAIQEAIQDVEVIHDQKITPRVIQETEATRVIAIVPEIDQEIVIITQEIEVTQDPKVLQRHVLILENDRTTVVLNQDPDHQPLMVEHQTVDLDHQHK